MRTLALVLTFLCLSLPAAAQPAAPPTSGILLLAHGGAKGWNDSVAAVASEIDREQPVEVAFGMATRRNIQGAVDRLIERGVTEIVAVPLFVSPHSSVVRSSEYLLGLRPDAPADLAIFARMDHGPAAGHGDHAAHAGHGAAAPAEDGTQPIVSRVPIRMAPALGRHPLVAAILADRARALSQEPAREVVVLVAHGPVPQDDNDRWLADLGALAGEMRRTTRFAAIEWQTVRDDAPAPMRDEAAAELRNRVTRITAAGNRALIVPVLISFGGIERGVQKRLDGLDYTMASQGLLPDARIGQWIREMAGTDVQAGDTEARLFESVTVSATLTPSVVKETPGTVSVIDDRTIARRLIENNADLVKFEPGVYVETTANRIGLNGFNIRGIGGNRVMTQVDGVDTSEQFDFGPFNVHQFGLDLDTLKSAEIVRSAGSALYGSDALGGVVSFFTKDPGDYLGSRAFHAGGKLLFDGRADDTSANAVVAGGRGRVTGSLFASSSTGHELTNQGTIVTEDGRRTALNPQDRRTAQALGKVVATVGSGQVLKGAVEVADHEIETNAFSSRTATVLDIGSDDTMRRQRFSFDHEIAPGGARTLWSWSAYAQTSDTSQDVRELRAAGASRIDRLGTLDYEQDSYGLRGQGRATFVMAGGHEVIATAGADYKHHRFDMLRDRTDVDTRTGAIVPPVGIILPSKYFPASDVGETGVYAQAEMKLGRLTLVPGLRYDRFSMDADEDDAVFLATLSPAPVDFDAGALSSRLGAAFSVTDVLTLHGQYAGGFRAPPYSAVNSGFTNLQGGYTSIPNPDLDPETSHNLEGGARLTFGGASAGATVFSNRYDDFIQQALIGVNPTTRLQEYQYRNLAKVAIHGVELQGEVRMLQVLRLRGAYAWIRGNDVSGAEDVPLDSIAPDQGVLGLEYSARSGRWGGELSARASSGQRDAVTGSTFYAPAAYVVADVTGWIALPHRLTLRAGILNLADATYFEWANVRGRSAADPLIDRYSAPGRSGVVSLGYGW